MLDGAERQRRLIAAAVAAMCLLLVVYLIMAAADESALDRANRLMVDDRYEEAITVAREVDGTPAEGEADAIVARALSGLGRLEQAADLFARASEGAPSDWTLHRDRALVLEAAGRGDEALAEITVALRLNPRLDVPDRLRR